MISQSSRNRNNSTGQTLNFLLKVAEQDDHNAATQELHQIAIGVWFLINFAQCGAENWIAEAVAG
ncbi:MAG: hypothetical protein A3J49_06175 [Gallionellales bacterium RIFCSPHIGHO2_02_FULL_57_16]|nr:MAG: hypothetical protein A3J49_06175 [Gallionellales bacterium RIFCSPHIGHO2_02_FULL_57_16]